MATLDELKAKLQSIINEYKVVSKEKNKTFGIAATPTIKDYHFVVKDEKPVKEDAKWIGKRTITKVESRGPSRYENIYAEALDANGEPALISPADADGELPAAAKDAKDKNLLALAARLKEVGGNTLTVGLIWDIANPHDKPNPNPQEPFYYEIVDSDFKEVEKDQKWTAKRTITKKSATAQGAKNVYKNVYSREKGNNQPQVLNGEGELPNDAKSSSHKNFERLIPKMKSETLTVDLVWLNAEAKKKNSVTPPKDEPKQEEPKREMWTDKQRKEYEQALEIAKRNLKYFPEPELNTKIPFNVPFVQERARFENEQDFQNALKQIKLTLDLYRDEPKFKGLTVEITVTTTERPFAELSYDGLTSDGKYKKYMTFTDLLEFRENVVRNGLLLFEIPNARNLTIDKLYEQPKYEFYYKYVLR